ncbi:MAG: hypothetical protein AAB250_05990, partial [Bdellovibrionota bacterium]
DDDPRIEISVGGTVMAKRVPERNNTSLAVDYIDDVYEFRRQLNSATPIPGFDVALNSGKVR